MTSSLDALEAHVQPVGVLMMAGSRHRWSKEGTKALIRAVDRSSHMALLMGSTTAPNVGIWRGVLEAMGEHGTGRTVEQLRSKWKGLKASFHLERDHRAATGHPSRKTPIGYRRLLQMWTAAGQPRFRDRHSTVAMVVPQPPHRRRQRQRARPLSPEEEDEENQPATSGTARGEEEPPTSPGTATEGFPPSPVAGSPLLPSPVQGMAQEEEDALLPSATSTQDVEEDGAPQQQLNQLLLRELTEQQEIMGQQLAVMDQQLAIMGQQRDVMQRQHHQTSRLLQLLRRRTHE